MPQFGATFYPGGTDDYYMPQVYAPAPQRVMPEVPQNMQQDLQRMELEARSVEPRRDGSQAPPTTVNTKIGVYGQQYQTPQPGNVSYSPASNYSPYPESSQSSPAIEKKPSAMGTAPSFSPFPKVQGEHIPLSDEEKENVLYKSRDHVLHSNNPVMQICWARDVLSYVEIAAEAAHREFEASRNPAGRDSARPATPQVEHQLRMDAVNIVNYLADQEHPEAVFIRSKWLEFGKFGKRQDKKEAYKGYTVAAQRGWGRAEYRIGMLYESSNDMEKAMWHYQQGLALKDSAASYRLGMISLMGQHNQPKDIRKGLDLIESAAENADEDAPQGSFVYGMIIARDLPDVNVPEGYISYDVAVARQYIEKAAYLGFTKAQLKMGQAYELCQLGCDFNPALSLHYYGLASRQGQAEACLGVSRWFLFGYEGTFAKNEQLAFKYAQLAAKAKLPTGEFALGYYNEIGIHVEKDLREARRWYELAAEHGNKDAVGRLEGLSQSKTLTKQDHETTTLTRIKSQHGSQRGKRPERFKQRNNDTMPTLSEGDRDSPGVSPGISPRVSPQPSPRMSAHNHSEMPDPSRPNTMLGNGRSPAFTVNLPDRPKSSAPYPEDDKPPPLNLARPRSSAPYPDDDIVGSKPQLSPHYNPGIRPSADRPGSAFGIRTQSPGHQGAPTPTVRPSQSSGNLAIPPAGVDPNRGRPVSASAGWQPQIPAGYRQQQSPGPRAQESGIRPVSANYDPRLAGGRGGPPSNNPAPNRLTKASPMLPLNQTPSPAQFPMGAHGSSAPVASNPGRDYGPRMSSRPVSSIHDPYGGRASAVPNLTTPTMSGGMAPRADSMGSSVHSSGLPTGGPGSSRIGSARPGTGPGVPLKDRPMDPGAGRSSAPPNQSRPGPSPAPSTSTTGGASVASAPATSKPAKSGPATFEEMGIPQGKNDGDCVVM